MARGLFFAVAELRENVRKDASCIQDAYWDKLNMEANNTCPYNYKPMSAEEHEQIRKHHAMDQSSYVRVGPTGYVVSSYFLKHGAGVRHLPLRSDDVFVVSYPRSGTTWTQELVWLVANDLNFEKAKSIALSDRYQFLEFYMMFTPEWAESYAKDEETRKIYEKNSAPAAETLNSMTSQRFIKSHLALSLLPTALLDTSKVVYVARDMRDVAVSVYHFYKAIKLMGVDCSFKEYYENMFSKNMLLWSPYFEHIKEAWAQRDHPNLLFLFYEDLSKDLKACAKRVADFFGKQYTDEQLDRLCDHLAFNNFQKNKSVHLEDLKHLQLGTEKYNFIRKGKAGGWREYFDEEMERHAESWMREQLQGTGIRFPQ